MVVDGRTVTLHSSTWSLPVRVGDAQVQFVHAQPDRVEVLEADGRHHSRRVHDVTYVARVALGIASIVIIALGARVRRRNAAAGSHA
jgi:hypothetical protein